MTADPARGQEQMFTWIAGLADQVDAAGCAAGLETVTAPTGRPAQLLICGMGGSAMAGSLLADGWPGLTVPVAVHRDAGLPDWAGPTTQVVACSHSGNTAETLDAAVEARRRGCPLVAVTGGGRLRAMAEGDGGPPFPAVRLEPTAQPPRTALGASLGALLHVCHRLGLLPDPAADIAAATSAVATGELVTLADGSAGGDSQARALAADLAGRFTVIFSAGREAHGTGRRLLAQLQENAKAAGHHACFPELDHNEIVGWNLPADDRDRFTLVVLEGAATDRDLTRRVDVTLELLADQFAGIHRLRARGEGHLTRVLGLVLFGDLVSAHLAVASARDPVPIDRIDALKSRLDGG